MELPTVFKRYCFNFLYFKMYLDLIPVTLALALYISFKETSKFKSLLSRIEIFMSTK